MKQNTDQVIRWVGLSEGGYVNHPKDPGGATDRGITQRTFDAWRKQQGQPRKSVRGISKAEADRIIAAQYLAPVMFDDLPSGLDYAMADYSVNSGPAKAVKDLQKIVGVTSDGIMGAMTLAAVSKRDATDLIVALCNKRMAFLRVARNRKTNALLWPTFGEGWTARVMGSTDGVQIGDIGVIDRAVMLATKKSAIPDPKPQVTAKAPPAPEPETVAEDTEAKGALVGVGGAVVASGGVISAIGALDPLVQALAVGGLAVAVVALLWIFRKRLARMAE